MVKARHQSRRYGRKSRCFLRGGARAPYDTNPEIRRFLQEVQTYSPFILRLLSAYWALRQTYPQIVTFADRLLGPPMENLDLGNPEVLQRALDHVRRHGIHQSTTVLRFGFRPFFFMVYFRLESITCQNVAWNRGLKYLEVVFPQATYRFSPGQTMKWQPREGNLCDIYTIVIVHNNFMFRIRIAEQDHEIGECSYFISYRGNQGTCHDISAPGIRPGFPARFPTVVARMEVQWGGPIGMTSEDYEDIYLEAPEIYTTV